MAVLSVAFSLNPLPSTWILEKKITLAIIHSVFVNLPTQYQRTLYRMDLALNSQLKLNFPTRCPELRFFSLNPRGQVSGRDIFATRISEF